MHWFCDDFKIFSGFCNTISYHFASCVEFSMYKFILIFNLPTHSVQFPKGIFNLPFEIFNLPFEIFNLPRIFQRFIIYIFVIFNLPFYIYILRFSVSFLKYPTLFTFRDFQFYQHIVFNFQKVFSISSLRFQFTFWNFQFTFRDVQFT